MAFIQTPVCAKRGKKETSCQDPCYCHRIIRDIENMVNVLPRYFTNFHFFCSDNKLLLPQILRIIQVIVPNLLLYLVEYIHKKV